jgi:predicted lipoprotein with Yx(FWY)xxD motif
VTANGWPLYYWQGDEAEGDTAGQGVDQVWWVLGPDGTPIRGGESEPENGGEQEVVQVLNNEEYGDILAGPDGLTLYMFDSDEQGSGASSCSGGCAESWPPLTVDGEPAAGSGVEAELSTIERGDGTTQVAANGWPLYYFANDGSQGDATGQGVNEVWWVLASDGTPIRGSDDGDGGDDSNEGDDGSDDGGDDGDDGNGGDDGDDGDDGNGGGDPGPY